MVSNCPLRRQLFIKDDYTYTDSIHGRFPRTDVSKRPSRLASQEGSSTRPRQAQKRKGTAARATERQDRKGNGGRSGAGEGPTARAGTQHRTEAQKMASGHRRG